MSYNLLLKTQNLKPALGIVV